MRQLVRTTKAIADESRIRILGALRSRELCVCQLIELLGLAPSTVSKHLSILKNARLVNSRKQGRWMYYRLAGEDAPEAIKTALAWVLSSLADKHRTVEDEQRLIEILKIDPEILCSRQAQTDRCEDRV
ncbi:MAG: ArsR family transcriptional regulator [Planctomycetota bacterium]|nr:MAG: ArsR family transcriptional regulator [Planctomycetota bacterium]